MSIPAPPSAQPTLAEGLPFWRQAAPEVPLVVGVAPDEPVTAAIAHFHRYRISPLPALLESGHHGQHPPA